MFLTFCVVTRLFPLGGSRVFIPALSVPCTQRQTDLIAHILTAHANVLISEQSSTLMNEASYCMYNIQHFFSLRSSIATSKSLLFPLQGDSIADQPHRLNLLLSIEVDALDDYAIGPPVQEASYQRSFEYKANLVLVQLLC